METNEVLHGKITCEITDNTGILNSLSQIPYTIEEEDSSLTIAADVLANSTRYLLGKKVQDNLGIELNSYKAIFDHPLFNLCYGFWLLDKKDYADTEYPYPL